MAKTEELRTRILDAAAELFTSKGIKFTMDDLAHSLGMSKKTIYMIFRDKYSIMTDTIDRFFRDAMEERDRIMSDPTLDLAGQLRALIGAVPERYMNIDLRKLYVLKDKYPAVYRHWQMRRREYWTVVEDLLEEGIRSGVIRPAAEALFRTMFLATLETFFQNDVLYKYNISYPDALREVAIVMIDGIVMRED